MSARPSRRGLLALGPALAALAPASAASPAPHPDAELLAAVERFRALTAQHAAIFRDAATEADDDARNAAVEAMHGEWEAALDALCAAPPAQTLAGVAARAVALVEFAPEKLRDDHGFWDEGQLAALLRDLVALAGQKPAG
jgi:hypothetical protein